MEDKLIEIDKDKFINFLLSETDFNTPWIQRKEVSAWSALLFLYAILWALTSFFNYQNSFFTKENIIPFSIMIYAICFVFFRFIHSQYSSIYYMSARTTVIKEIILNLCETGNSFFEKNGIFNYEDCQTYLNNKTEYALKNTIQKFRGKIHPLRILIYFWTYLFIWIFRRDKRKLNLVEKAEASIYSLIVLVVIFYTWYLYYMQEYVSSINTPN